MRRTRFVLLALVATLAVVLLGAGRASAATTVIDANDDAGPVWAPDDVSVAVGDTVRWEFDEAQTTHNLSSNSANWSIDLDRAPGGAPIEHTFTAPGTYSFLCKLHAGMTGSVTVADPADPLEKVLVFSKTAGFRHTSIPNGIAAIQQLGAANDFAVDATEDASVFTDANLAQYDVLIFLSTTGDVLNTDQQAAFERYIRAGGGFAGIHAAADTEYDWPWYGEMLGGYFLSHPAGTPTANVINEDANEPSTTGIPATWTRVDEWYGFRSPATVPGELDYSPRESGVHVLMTVDETTYEEGDGTAAADDHPIAWCTDFDGGRVWYTGMGHTEESFGEADFRKHLLGGIQTAAGAAEADCGAPREAPSANDFEKVPLDDDTANPMEMDIAEDGRVFYIERGSTNTPGLLRIWDPATEQSQTAGSLPIYAGEENGLIGLKLAPDFATSGWVYLTYSATPESTNQQRVSRFRLVGDTLDIGSEQIILTWQHQRERCCHSSGSIAFGPDGALYVSTGDNTDPFESDGFAPIDERLGRTFFDAQRTSANTNDLNGKVLRVMPMANPTGPPGVNSTYTIPAGNLFDEAQDTQSKTRPEIYAMGFRNPFRLTVDPETGWVLLGDYGPDAGASVESRGPQGSVEWNVIKQAGNFGWPYCVRDNVPYRDYDFASGLSGPAFTCSAPVNNSPNNTGLTQLPPAQPAAIWEGYTEMDPRNPGIGKGGAPTGGPRYHFDPDAESLGRLPEVYDGRWFIGEWNNNWIKTVGLDAAGNPTDTRCFAICRGIKRPMDMEIGPDGHLYVIEWGTEFGGANSDSGVYRFDFIRTGRRPAATATATPDNGPAPLTVQFSSAGSADPDGTAITYAWDFDGNGTTDSTEANPTHEYTATGNYTATLRVTDASGQSGVDNVPITVGNTKPVVTIEIPENGQFASFGEEVPYRITVTDAEDGTIGPGSPDCSRVTLNVNLGHDGHSHTLANENGCEGTFNTMTDGGHGGQANIFPLIEAVYTDRGGAGTSAPLTDRDEVILNTKRKQVEYFDSTGRVAGAPAGGDPGVQTETSTDEGGGLNIGFIEDGDYVSYAPVNLENLDEIAFRVASAGAGGTIELRRGAADGPLITQANVTPTGGWQSWQTVEVPLPPTEGTFELFLVFRGPAGGLLNLNWIQVHGKGAAVTAAPDVTAAASPTTGEAPLEVRFDGEATDPEGAALTYRWDFGVSGTTDDTSTALDPTYTYARAGTYTATLTATDAAGGKASATVQVRVTAPAGECPTGPVHSDEFDGAQLDAERWSVLRPDPANPLTVAGGTLKLPIAQGSIYEAGTTAKNIVVQDAPDGAWEATTKITVDPLTENYHQAGLRVYAGDNNWASVHMIHAGGQRDFEFILESNGVARNGPADKLGGIADQSPLTYWVRLTSDGETLRAYYSFNGDDFTQVGQPASLATFVDPKIGPVALSGDTATTVPNAYFDWIRFNPDGSTGGGGGGPVGPSRDDHFDGSSLDTTRWNAIVRESPASYAVAGGNLTITTEPGDIYSTDTTPPPNNFILQSADHAGADWVIETKVDSAVNGGYGQGGLIAYLDGNNYVKLDPIADAGQTRINRIELRTEIAGTPTGPATDPQIAAGTGTEFWLRLTKAGNDYTGEYSRDGTTWSPAGTVQNPMASPSFGLYAFGPQAEGQGDTVSFEYFTLDGEDTGECSCVGKGDEFDGAAIDKTRFNDIVREDETKYTVQNGQLNVTTVNGDIYTNSDPAPTRNFFLQTADHAGPNWVIETKVNAIELSGGYEQAGLLARKDDDNYVKFDIISDDTQTALNRIELRSEVAGAIQNPQPQLMPLPANDGNVWLRLSKTGTDYKGEYSFDGSTWTAFATVPNAMTEPSFGLFTLGVNSPGGTARFDYLEVDGDRGDCEPPPTNRAPQIQSATAAPTIGLAPLPVSFTAAATDPDAGDTVTYSWDFGDGSAASTEQNPTHTYAEPGDYTAKLTVSDGEATATRNVQVTALEPDDPDARFRALVFSKTAGFRHSSIDEGHAAIEQLGADNNFQVDHTEDATAFRDGILSHYDAVVWLSTTGDVLNDNQQSAFERFIKAGHGYAGIHAAADTEYDWKWYGRLVGAYFLSHPSGTHPNGGRDGTVIVEDTTDHSTQGLPAPRWNRIDEWYNYKPVNFEQTGNVDFSPRADVHVLASLDESTYDEADGSDGVDDDHPISWCHKYQGGRSWYTGMGHTDDSFSEAPFLRHILGGIEEAAGTEGSDICNIAPTVEATADPRTGQAPLPVAFSANGSDAEGAALTYSWDFGDGGTSLRQNPDHTYREPGTYTAKVTVKDPKGATGTATVEIVVTNPPGNVAPTVQAAGDPTAGKPPLAVQFSATGSDPDGDALTYAWDFGDGGSSLLQNPSHTYSTAGTYTAKVTVSDTKGATATATVQVTVGNRGPSVALTATPTSGRAPLTVNFSASGSDPDGDALSYAYAFGDGKTATGRTATHKYAKAGVYTAKVTVTDTGGATATAEVQITVTKK